MTKKLPARHHKLPYMPRFEGPFQGRAFNWAKQLHPKLGFKGLEFDDLLQEAAMVFFSCRKRYEGTVDNPAWFMSLFQRALFTRSVDLQRTNFPYIPFDEAGGFEELASDDSAAWWDFWSSLPADIQSMLSELSDSSEILPALTERLREVFGANQTLTTKES